MRDRTSIEMLNDLAREIMRDFVHIHVRIWRAERPGRVWLHVYTDPEHDDHALAREIGQLACLTMKEARDRLGHVLAVAERAEC